MGVEWRAVQLGGAVRDWGKCDSSYYMKLLIGNCRSEHRGGGGKGQYLINLWIIQYKTITGRIIT